MALCRPRQLTYARNLLTKRFPAHHQDFTRLFPRVLSLYIFSFLDPRSLCRAAQVSFLFSRQILCISFVCRHVGIGNFSRNRIRFGCQSVFVLAGHQNILHHLMKVMFGNEFIRSIFKHYKQCLFE